jgi:hypothetical protein
VYVGGFGLNGLRRKLFEYHERRLQSAISIAVLGKFDSKSSIIEISVPKVFRCSTCTAPEHGTPKLGPDSGF